MPLATQPLDERQARWDEVRYLRDKKGWEFGDIGAKFGVTRSRAEKIYKRPRPERQYGGRPARGG